MNTHDIELPPLPPPFGIVDPDGAEGMMQYTTKDLQDYAKVYALSAIEADRKHHDRMLAHEWIRPALGLSEDAPYRFDFYAQEIEKLRAYRKRRGEPVGIVKRPSESHYPGVQWIGDVRDGEHLYASPQPAEPVKSADEYDQELAGLGSQCNALQNALAFYMPDVPEADHPLHDRIAQDVYLLCGYDGSSGVEPSAHELGLISLVGRSAEPVKVPSDADIEAFMGILGMRWDGSVWKIEDADLHPMVRALLARYGQPAQPAGGQTQQDSPTPEEKEAWQQMERRNE